MNTKRHDRVTIAAPRLRDTRQFVEAVKKSTSLHRPWTHAPNTEQAYKDYVARNRSSDTAFFNIWLREEPKIAGVANLSEIVLGRLQSAYLGFYAMAGFTGCGYMTEGVDLVLRHAFKYLRLHRVEANVQPDNTRSLALVARLGFRKEGFSPKYLKLGGRWRDHERWAILRDEWIQKGTRRS